MDQLQLDAAFIQETLREPPNGFTDQEIQFRPTVGHFIFEYTNINKRLEVQFRIASHLEPFVLEQFRQKSDIVEMLAIKIHRIILVGAYVPDGRSRDGILQ